MNDCVTSNSAWAITRTSPLRTEPSAWPSATSRMSRAMAARWVSPIRPST